jgi:hypothetical protein
MPPAAQESQGLKIAVAVFVMLTVIFAVTSYFMYSSYSQALAKQRDAEGQAKKSDATAQTAVTQLTELKGVVGHSEIEDFDALKAAIKKDTETLLNDLVAVDAETKKLHADYTAAGGSDANIKRLADASEQLAGELRDEPNKTFAASLKRLAELLKSESLLSHAYAVDNIHLRDSLKSADAKNEARLNEQTDATKKSKEDLEQEHTTHETNRQDLLAKVDKLQTELSNVSTEYENAKTKWNAAKEDYDKKLADLRTQLAFYRDESTKNKDIMDQPDGTITTIDYTRREVHTDLTKQMGARSNMVFAVFDRREPIPNPHPKAHIQLSSVTERGSIGRIMDPVRTGQNLQSSADIPEPIHLGDFVYSNSWSPTTPTRYALIGKIDMDRDGRDDREDLKRLIKASGGVIEYDLPPPGAGKESGKLTSLISYYVEDTRVPLADIGRERVKGQLSQEEIDFFKRQTESMREARLLGIQPLPIERLLTWLGYSPFMTTYGRREAFDKQTSDSILFPRGRPVNVPAPSGDTPPAAPGENGKAANGDEAKSKEAAPK